MAYVNKQKKFHSIGFSSPVPVTIRKNPFNKPLGRSVERLGAPKKYSS